MFQRSGCNSGKRQSDRLSHVLFQENLKLRGITVQSFCKHFTLCQQRWRGVTFVIFYLNFPKRMKLLHVLHSFGVLMIFLLMFSVSYMYVWFVVLFDAVGRARAPHVDSSVFKSQLQKILQDKPSIVSSTAKRLATYKCEHTGTWRQD